jgi:hypothetical protein
LRHCHGCHRARFNFVRCNFNWDFRDSVISIAPEEGFVNSRLVSLVVAGEHILPVTFSKLTEVKMFHRAYGGGSVVDALELFFLGEVHAHKFI